MKNHNDYVAGIPDDWYSADPHDLWVEYKYLPISNPRKPVIPDLSPQQFHWIKSRKNEGRNVWVIVGYKSGGVIYTDLNDMERGIGADDFLARTLTRQELAQTIEAFCSKKQPSEKGDSEGLSEARTEGG
jgi:hypothetical protein